MRIDPARLFSPPPHLSPAKRSPDGHGLAEKGNQPAETLPSAWHFEHNDWLVGGLGVWPTSFLLKDALPLWKQRLHAWCPTHFPKANSRWPHESQVYLHHQGRTVFFSGHLFLSVLKHMGRKRQSCPQRLIHLLLAGRPLASHTRPFAASRFFNLGRSRTPTDGNAYSITQAFPSQSTRTLITHLDDVQLSWRGKDVVQELAPLKGKLQLHGVPDVFENPSHQALVQNWVMDGPKPHYRSQALGAHPLPLAGLVLRQWQPRKIQPYDLGEDPGAFDLAPINALIDQGHAWKPAMLQHVLSFLDPLKNAPDFLALLEEVQRGFQRLSKTSGTLFIPTSFAFPSSSQDRQGQFSFPGLSSAPAYVRMVWLMGLLQVADLPRSGEQWASCFTLLNTLTQLPDGVNHHHSELTIHAKRERIRHYRTHTRGLTRATDPKEWLISTLDQSLLSQVRWDVYPWIARAFDDTCLPLAHWSPRLWLRAHQALHLAHRRATRRQIEALARQQESVAGLEHQAAWPACLPTRAALAGYRFHALLNPIVLTKEGDRMGHCVAGYVGACASGKSRIYSMEAEAGEERVTLELVQAERGHFPVVAQLQGPYNSSPTDQATQAVQAFLESIKSWPDHKAWPSVELSPCWQRFLNARQSVEDEPFFEDVRNWVACNAPRIPDQTPPVQ